MRKLKYTFIALITMLCALTLTSCMDLYDDNEIDTVLTLTFDGNGGSYIEDGKKITEVKQKFVYGEKQALNENKFAKSGYVFMGWNEGKSGQALWADKAEIAIKKHTTLYAVWEKEGAHNVSYVDGVDDEEIDVPAKGTHETGDTVVVSFDIGEREGYTFKGWVVSGLSNTTYFKKPDSGDRSFKMPSNDVTLTADWGENTLGGGITMNVIGVTDLTLGLSATASGTAVTIQMSSDYTHLIWLADGVEFTPTPGVTSEGKTSYSWNSTSELGFVCITVIVKKDGTEEYYSASTNVKITG